MENNDIYVTKEKNKQLWVAFWIWNMANSILVLIALKGIGG